MRNKWTSRSNLSPFQRADPRPAPVGCSVENAAERDRLLPIVRDILRRSDDDVVVKVDPHLRLHGSRHAGFR